MCLPELDHNWPRYVLPTGATLSLTDGFLPDPEDRYGRYSNVDLLTLAEFFNRRCCILLGDAGIGKSDVLRKEFGRVQTNAQNPENVIFRSLRDFGSDVTAEQFLTSQEITGWIADPSAELFLFLDSLDEALLKVDTWSFLLGKALMKWPLQRLWLRITCRPAFWPESLGIALARGFGENLIKVSHAPLRQRDVESAAGEHAVQVDHLLAEIRRANAASFAARPLTLKMIFKVFADHSRLPDTHAKMYREGCRYLAAEHNADVLEGHRLTDVSIDRRMTIVERMAAMSVFCDRRFLQHPNAADAPLPEGTLSASAICSKDVTSAELREVLASALFSFQTPDVLVWTNWSYAEFLAASWCISERLTTASIQSLISIAGDAGTGIPQQLSSTAIWMGELRHELQHDLVELNPSLLLFIDEGAVNPRILPKLVKQTVERKTTWELSRQISSYAHRFKYPGIAKRLRKYLRRPQKDWECATAIYIATACELSELSRELLAIVENRKLSLDIRHLAASAIAHVGTTEARLTMRHFAIRSAAEDDKDNLKGAALSANWPEHLTSGELTSALTRPRSGSHSGYYESFLVKLANGLSSDLPAADVLILMQWAEQDWLSARQNAFFDAVIDRIMIAAWEKLEDTEIRQAFVVSLLKRLRNYLTGFPWRRGLESRNEWPDRLSQDRDRRKLLLRDTILAVEYSPYILRCVCSALSVVPTDASLFLQIAREGDAATREKIGFIFFALGREEDQEVLTAVYEGIREGVLEIGLSAGLSIELGSEAARELRAEYDRPERQKREREDAIEQLQRSAIELLDRSEAGEADAWYRIWNSVLTVDWPELSRWGGTPRLDELGCWDRFDETTRERFYGAAQLYLLNGTRPPLDFLGQSGWPNWVNSECTALFSSSERFPETLLSADDEVWKRWSTLAVWNVFTGFDERSRTYRTFLAQRSAPFIAAVQELLNLYVPQQRCSSIADGLRFDWTPDFANYLLQQVQRADLTNSCWDTLCGIGLDEAPELFEPYLWSEFAVLCRRFGKARDERITATVALMLRHAKPGTWTALRELIFSEPQIGEGAISRAGDISQKNNWMERFGDGEVAEFYIWMMRQFDPDIGQFQGAAFIGGPVTIRMLRDSTMVSLRNRGNLKVFRSVLQALPEVAWLPRQLAYVEEAHFHRQWRVETPEGLLRMAEENRVPWYQKKSVQVILVVATFLGLAASIIGIAVASGFWRTIACVMSVAFVVLAVMVIRVFLMERRPK